MGKERAAPMGLFLREMFQFGVYKGSQGYVARRSTFAALAVTFLMGSFRLFVTLRPRIDGPGVGYLAAGGLLVVGLWFSYRIVNFPKFADFLIAVEAEMNKVSWPTRGELMRSSIVVIFVILSLAAILFCFDLFWQTVFQWLGVLKEVEEPAVEARVLPIDRSEGFLLAGGCDQRPPFDRFLGS